jgi:phenylalanyl-tRNA synthetase alpha chain
VRALPLLQGFDVIDIPEIVPASVSFDLFNFPAEHPARSTSDTYYIDSENILRTHDTVFWYYYLRQPEIQEKIARGEPLSALCHGKVYRKDEIDRRHMNIFHQMGGWHLIPNEKGTLTEQDLKDVLSQIVTSIFGPNIEYRFNLDTFPYTDPSLEVEVKIGEEWVEILGGGMPKASVLAKLGLTGYNGWAFGFGLERLAIISMQLPDIRLLWSADERVIRQLVLGKPYQMVSKYPPSVRDISFIVPKSFVPNNYFDLVREVAGDLVEEVKLLDKYENDEKFGEDKMSYAFRITYRAIDHTLTGQEIDALHHTLETETVKDFGASIR